MMVLKNAEVNEKNNHKNSIINYIKIFSIHSCCVREKSAVKDQLRLIKDKLFCDCMFPEHKH